MDCDDRSSVEFSRRGEPHLVRFTLSHAWTRGLIVSGALFNMVSSIFLPWGITPSSIYLYLPWSIVNGTSDLLPPSEFFKIMQVRAQLLTISVLSKATVIVGLAGVVLCWYVGRRMLSRMLSRVLSYSVILASSFISFIAVAIFTLTEISLTWGAYLAVVGGVLMVLGVVVEGLEVEVVVEREVSEQAE